MLKNLKLDLVLWPVPVKMRQEGCHRPEASLDDVIVARSARAALQDPIPANWNERKKALKIVEVNFRYDLDAGLKNTKPNFLALCCGVVS